MEGEKGGVGKQQQQPAPASNDLTGEVEKKGQYPAALGGYADVYEATWKRPGGDVDVAIKVLRMRIVSPEDDTKIRKVRLRPFFSSHPPNADHTTLLYSTLLYSFDSNLHANSTPGNSLNTHTSSPSTAPAPTSAHTSPWSRRG